MFCSIFPALYAKRMESGKAALEGDFQAFLRIFLDKSLGEGAGELKEIISPLEKRYYTFSRHTCRQILNSPGGEIIREGSTLLP